MIEEALTKILEQNAEVMNAKILRIPGDDRMCYIDQDGEVTAVEIPPPNRQSHVASVDDLCAAVKAYGKPNEASIWINTGEVVAVLDDTDRRERVTMHLRKNAAYAKLLYLASNPTISQGELINLLRMELRDISCRTTLLEAVRKIKFSSFTEGHSDLGQGRESLGKSIENKVSGASELPEDLLITTPMFDNPGERDESFTIELLFEVMASDSKFRIKPVPASLENAADNALQKIRSEIVEQLEGVRVFFGTP
jgi:hypothetical protein